MTPLSAYKLQKAKSQSEETTTTQAAAERVFFFINEVAWANERGVWRKGARDR